jgi:hypothetical protein
LVVPASKEVEVGSEVVRDSRLGKPGENAVLEGGKESLDPSILPGREGSRPLMSDTEAEESEPEEPGGEDRFVVGAKDPRSAVPFDRIE